VAVVALLAVIAADAVPKSTVVGLVRLVPITVTRWPPEIGPELAMTPVTTGVLAAAAGVTPTATDTAALTMATTRAEVATFVGPPVRRYPASSVGFVEGTGSAPVVGLANTCARDCLPTNFMKSPVTLEQRPWRFDPTWTASDANQQSDPRDC
jgi:hypothetical protein